RPFRRVRQAQVELVGPRSMATGPRGRRHATRPDGVIRTIFVRRLTRVARARQARICARYTTAEVLIGAVVRVRIYYGAVTAQAHVRRTRLHYEGAADHPFRHDGIRAKGLDGVAVAIGLFTVGVCHEDREIPLRRGRTRKTTIRLVRDLPDRGVGRTFGAAVRPGEQVVDLAEPLAVPGVFQIGIQ